MTPSLFSISTQSEDLKRILMTGRVSGNSRDIAIPYERARVGTDETVIFRLFPREQIQKPGRLKKWLIATRALHLTATLSPSLAVILYGLSRQWEFSLGHAVTALLGVFSLQVSVHLLNDVEDHLRLVDLSEGSGGSRVIQRGWMSARRMKAAGIFALGLAFACGIPALVREPLLIGIVGVLALLACLGFSGHPFGFKYRGLGEASVFFAVGPLLATGFALAAFGRTDGGVLGLGAFFGLATCAILLAGNLPDFEIDRRSGASTWVTLLGFRKTQGLLLPLFLLTDAVAAVLAWRGALPWVSVAGIALLLPFQIQTGLRARRASGPASVLLERVRRQTLWLHLALGLAVALGLMAGI